MFLAGCRPILCHVSRSCSWASLCPLLPLQGRLSMCGLPRLQVHGQGPGTGLPSLSSRGAHGVLVVPQGWGAGGSHPVTGDFIPDSFPLPVRGPVGRRWASRKQLLWGKAERVELFSLEKTPGTPVGRLTGRRFLSPSKQLNPLQVRDTLILYVFHKYFKIRILML